MNTAIPGFSSAGERSPRSRFPVCDELQPRLKAEGNEWALELARWYEADWALAVEGGPQPSAASVLPLIDPERQAEIRTVLEAIDARYSTIRNRRASAQEASALDSSVDVAPSERSAAPAPEQTIDSHVRAESDSEYENIANTLEFSDASDALEQTADFQPGKLDEGFDASGIEATLDVSGSETARAQESARRIKQIANSIPGYRIEGVLGRGGMGVVYLARQQGIDRKVALKMILSGGHADQTMLDRFQAEARAIGRFQHENIVRIFDSGFHKGMPYFSLEFIKGKTLSEYLDGKPIEPIEAATLLEPMARALQYAHDAGVIHRDLKPGNVLLTEEHVPKITDFGLAKELETDEQLSVTGAVVGTPAYMAPEQARGDGDVGKLADVYGLGAMLYCMITGRPPFQGAKATDTLIQVIRQDPVEPIKLQPGIPKDLETICLKCLQKEKGQRYQSAAELADDLGRFVRGEPIAARPVSRTERAWRWCKRNPKMAIASGLAAALALIVMIGGPASAAIIWGQKQEVLAAKDEAEANATIAERNEAAATAAKEIADKNAEAAAVQEKNAIDALKSLTYGVQSRMAGRSDLIHLREELLETVRNGLQRMEQNQNSARHHNMIAAGIHVRLGDINMEIGRVTEAIEEYQKCVAIFETLSAKDALPYPDANWAKIHQLLGDAYRAAGELNEADAHHRKSLQIRQRVAEERRDDQSQVALAVTLGKLGSLARARGDLEAARNYMEQATALRKDLYEADMNDGRARAEYLGAQMVLAKVLFQQDASAKALDLMTEAVLGMRDLADKNPDTPSTQQNAAMFDAELGVLQLYLADHDAARKNFENAATTLTQLKESEPNDLRIHQELEEALYGLAVTLDEQEQTEAAEKLMQRVLAMRRESLQLDSANIQSQIRLLPVLARTGNVAEGVALATEIQQSLDETESTWYDLACGYALLAGEREHLAAEEAEGLPKKAQLTEAAIVALQKALEAGFDRPADLQLDPDLDPIRPEPAMQALLAKHVR